MGYRFHRLEIRLPGKYHIPEREREITTMLRRSCCRRSVIGECGAAIGGL
jgi:hypothetical protein